MTTTSMRNAGLEDLNRLLVEQHARKFDVVAPASKLRVRHGVLHIEGTEPELSEEGVTLTEGRYLPTYDCDGQIAGKLGIPPAYLRRLRTDRVDLYDANVNGWLHGPRGGAPDARKFLVRCFKPMDDGEAVGVARALLSDSYRIVDHLDVLFAFLDGVRDAGIDVEVRGCDLSERRMYVRVVAPQVQAEATTLLRGYRSPFTGDSGTDNPVVWAGLEFGNSEVGDGSNYVVPRIELQVCKNGMKVTKDLFRRIHVGSKLEEGVIAWSADTREKQVALIKAQTRDTVATILTPGYLQQAVAALEERAAEPIEDVDEVRVLGKDLRLSDLDMSGILAHFVKGGQMTRGGVANAITSYAQTVRDADTASDMEAAAVSLLV